MRRRSTLAMSSIDMKSPATQRESADLMRLDRSWRGCCRSATSRTSMAPKESRGTAGAAPSIMRLMSRIEAE
jgi:hypothetical protein